MVAFISELEFKWIYNEPKLRKVKQPEVLTPDEFLDLVVRIDNERVEPKIALRNQCMLLMTYFSCFRAVEVCQWKVKEALYPDGTLCQLTKLRKEATKGKYPAKAPVIVKEQRDFLEKWFDVRVKYNIGKNQKQTGKYRDLDPDSHVFMSFHHGRWQNFSLTRKISKGIEYFVATTVQNLLTKLYKEYGFPNSSSHSGRHSFSRFAQKVLERKNDPDAERIIQNLLHHRSEKSQRDYTEVNFKQILELSDNIMPRPKKRGRPKK